MTISPLPLEPEALAALSDFLRGIERRAAILAELLCGNPIQADTAVASAMLALRNAAAQRPLADRDVQFWRLLLATAALRRPRRDGHWPTALAPLAAHGSGMRALLLLRLLAGLDEAQAAAALCVPPDLLARAWRRETAGKQASTDDHPALQAAMQQRVRQLPPARLVQLAAYRERALRGAVAATAGREHVWRRSASSRFALVTAVFACTLAFVATFLFVGGGAGLHGAKPSPLPAAAPLATFDADFALMTHRDFEQLADPGNEALRRDLAFYSWYAAQTAPATDTPGAPLRGATGAASKMTP